MSRMSTLSSGMLAMALKQFYRCNKISFTNREGLRVQCKPDHCTLPSSRLSLKNSRQFSANDHLFTMATFFCPQGGLCNKFPAFIQEL